MPVIAKREAHYIIDATLISCIALGCAIVLGILYYLHFCKMRTLKKEIAGFRAQNVSVYLEFWTSCLSPLVRRKMSPCHGL